MTRTHPSGPQFYPPATTPPGQPPFPYGDPWARPGRQSGYGYGGHGPGYGCQQPYPGGPHPVAAGFDFRPRPSGRGRMWALLGSITAGVVLVVVLVVALATSGGDSSSDDHAGMVRLDPSATTSPGRDAAGDDESQIQQVVEDAIAAASGGTMADMAPYYCAAERKLVSGYDQVAFPETFGRTTVTVTNVRVKGKIATARIDGDPGYFRKESGEWKLCDSVKSEF